MMRWSGLVVAGIVAVGIVNGLRADRVDGSKIQAIPIPAAAKGEAFGETELVERFEGGKPARVIVVGDHDPVADLEIHVYAVSENGVDSKQAVAVDGGPEQGDRIGVVWYPPRTGNYRIVLRNPAPRSEKNPYCKAAISIR
jgi:hypothetical protein